MQVRKIQPLELKRVQEMAALSFEYEMDNRKTAEALYQQVQDSPTSRQEMHWQSQWVALEDDGKTLMSTLAVIPYPIHFDGSHTTMGGIGNVVTLPPYRRRGGIRACFQAALLDMYQQGTVFSYLYPFSTAYYRRFGYEVCCQRLKYKLLLDKLPPVSAPGSLHLVEQGHWMLEDIQTVYRTWQQRYNMMVVRQDIDFAWVKESNPFQDQRYTYVYRSPEGTPKGYITLQKVDEADGRNLNALRFVFVDREGLEGLLGLAASLRADHRYLVLPMPIQPNIEPMLPEWAMGASSRWVEQAGMVRVVHVEKALALARTRGEGSLRLEIKDEQISENNGCFQVRMAGGRVAEVKRVEAPPDITLPISQFSRLLVGAYDMEDVAFLPGVQLHGSQPALSSLFYPKPLCLLEYF